MVKRRSGYGTLIPGLLLLAGMLVVLGAGSLVMENDNHGMIPWLLIAALAAAVPLLSVGILLIVLPRLRAGTEADELPAEDGQSLAAGRLQSSRHVQTDTRDELLRTIQAIERNLDQAVAQVGTRLSGITQVSDDRGPIQPEVTEAETSNPDEKKKPRIH